LPKLPHVTWLRAFEAAARHNSFAAAAEELNLTSAAVSQQIRNLEQHLGAQLFRRLPRGVNLTDQGQAYAQTISKSFEDILLATNGLFDNERNSIVRVRASISCAALVLAPRLVDFKLKHPNVQLEVTTSVWADHFDEDKLDVDIRFGLGNWQEGQILHLGHETAVPVCHQKYAEHLSHSIASRDLSNAKLIRILGSETDWSKLSAMHGLNLPPMVDWMRVDSSLIALQTAAAGEGFTMVLENFAQQYLDLGLLVAPTPYRLPKRRSHYLVINGPSSKREEVRAFCTWVQALYQSLP